MFYPLDVHIFKECPQAQIQTRDGGDGREIPVLGPCGHMSSCFFHTAGHKACHCQGFYSTQQPFQHACVYLKLEISAGNLGS